MPFSVRTEVFEGPFDVLLRLISEQRVDVYEVKLGDIVDAFLEEVEALGRLDLEVATEFLVIAAILVELKSRRLLPPSGDEASFEDLALLEERDYLLARLVECRTFAAAGGRLSELEARASLSLPRIAGPDDRFVEAAPDLLARISPDELRAAAERAIAAGLQVDRREPERVNAEHVLVDEVTVADVVAQLATRLPLAGPTTFRRLTAASATRMEVVVHFLALLELYKQGLVDLDQPEVFGEMRVRWLGEDGAEPDDGGDTAMAAVASSARAALVDADYRG